MSRPFHHEDNLLDDTVPEFISSIVASEVALHAADAAEGVQVPYIKGDKPFQSSTLLFVEMSLTSGFI